MHRWHLLAYSALLSTVPVNVQRSPCAAHIPADDPNFTTTREEQEERLVFIAQYTDAVIRAKLLNDSAAANFVLHDVPNSPLVQAADLSPGCFENANTHRTQQSHHQQAAEA